MQSKINITLNKNIMNLQKEIHDVLWGVVNPSDAMWINTTAIKRLINNGIIENPYNGERYPEEIVSSILLNIKGREKDVLNLLPFKDRYSQQWANQNDIFNKKYNIPRPRTYEEKHKLISDLYNITN